MSQLHLSCVGRFQELRLLSRSRDGVSRLRSGFSLICPTCYLPSLWTLSTAIQDRLSLGGPARYVGLPDLGWEFEVKLSESTGQPTLELTSTRPAALHFDGTSDFEDKFSTGENRLTKTVIQPLSDYYRVPDCLLGQILEPKLSGNAGYFQFGPKITCYGLAESGVAARFESSTRYDASKDLKINGVLRLPFSPTEVIENLRRERYVADLVPGRERVVTQEWVLKSYYAVRKLLPASIRRRLQRAYFSDWGSRPFPAWPVDCTVDALHEELLKLSMQAAGIRRAPFIWFWPEGAPSCLIMTHDVETSVGQDFTSQLMDLDESYGIKGSFQVIPEKRYEVTDEYIEGIRRRGFEFNLHDLNHDGNLYRDRGEFLRRAATINEYARKYRAQGFRAGAMYRNLDWYDAFEFAYDMSLPNVAHLEPKRGGCCTVMPFFIGRILELPLTTIQDYSLFHILGEYSTDLWKKQLSLIRQRNGLMSFIAHPDYLIDRPEKRIYESLLDYLREMIDRERIWAALPTDVDQWWRARNQMKLVRKGADWEIVGPQKERARIAYAVLDGDRLRYDVADAPVPGGAHS